jgi:hypothetical protein
MNPLADQFPVVKTGNPAVRRMMMHRRRAVGVEYSSGREMLRQP